MIPLFEWLQALCTGANGTQCLPDWVLMTIAVLIPVKIAFVLVQAVAGGSTYIERKVAADIQRRVGPNQCNPNQFLGVFARVCVENAKQPKANFGAKAMGAALGLAIPVIDLIDKVAGRFVPGVLIFLADGIKLIMKESIVPSTADKPLFKMAPAIVLCSAFGALATVPYSSGFFITDLNIGIFYLAAITSLETIGILMAGWASNNKWALLGGMRSAAQIVSYELPAGLTVLTVILLAGTMSMQGIIYDQIGPNHWSQGWIFQWNVFSSPFMMILAPAYFLAALAECNRTPFDIPEAESELVAGYHTEYTGMNFAFFFMAEYAMMCVTSAIAVTVFLGGWSTGIGPLERAMMEANAGDRIPGTELVATVAFEKVAQGDVIPGTKNAIAAQDIGAVAIGDRIPGTEQLVAQPVYYWWASLVHLAVFGLKTYGLVFIMMWIRWTLPRFRVDQMMTLCWKKLIPIGMFCFTGIAAWTLLRKPFANWLGGQDAYLSLQAGLSIVVFLAVTGWLVHFFRTPLTPEDQKRRKLIADANLTVGTGPGMA
ncbi:MAG: NADH-quinone oxidoreductase subunit H [Planctomycetota bacterium]|nr:NADH-quinone oxidoreductase subunit H [Planctomycetota bacterium]